MSSALYDEYATFIHNHCRSEQNPKLELAPHATATETLTHLIVKVLNYNSGSASIQKKLFKFKGGESTFDVEPLPDGTYGACLEIPLPKKRSKKHFKKHTPKVRSTKKTSLASPSTTTFFVLVIALLVQSLVFVTTDGTKLFS